MQAYARAAVYSVVAMGDDFKADHSPRGGEECVASA